MKERERLIVGGLVVLLLLFWLGFLVHVSPRFAGSLWGGVLGVAGAFLMLAPLAYLIVKRVKRLKKLVTKRISMRTLLAWHIYAGVVGPILVILHTGHKFDSLLGIALTAMTLLVVVSGFVGRYLMTHLSKDIREKTAQLDRLQEVYDRTAVELAAQPQVAATVRPFSSFLSRLAAGLFFRDDDRLPSAHMAGHSPGAMLRLAESIADMEYAIKTHESFRRWFGKWLKFHIWISFVLYVLLALHVYFAVYFGLRWFK